MPLAQLPIEMYKLRVYTKVIVIMYNKVFYITEPGRE